MKNNKSQLDIFLLKRIEDNREELRHVLDSTLQVEQACLEEIVKGIRHCKTNITHCNLPYNEFVLGNGNQLYEYL